jgi:trk system potassium uptake protein TrkA
MKKGRTFAIIGLGRFGSAVATTLAELGHEVIGIDASADVVRELADHGVQALQMDVTDERALRASGIHVVDVAVVSIGENLEASLIVVMLVKELGVQTIVAKATTPLHGRILERLGVSRVVFPEREMAVRTAHSLIASNLVDYIELSPDFCIVEVPAPEEFVGKSVKDLQIRNRFGLNLIAIRRQGASGGDSTNVSPTADDRIERGDILAMLGSNANVARLDALKR